jgi:hypothetical protein
LTSHLYPLLPTRIEATMHQRNDKIARVVKV